MILGVISDTHDRLPQLESALQYFHDKGVKIVIHCGDWKSLDTVRYCAERAAELLLTVHGVLGNNDTDVIAFLNYALMAPGHFTLQEGVLKLEIGGKTITAYHGHHIPTKKRLLADITPDVLLLGHSHKPLIDNEAGRLLVNPGSTAFAIPRSKTWRPSVASVDLSDLTATIEFLPKAA